MLMARYVRKLGYCAKTFPDGKSALDWLIAHAAPHLIICDLRMNSGMSGFEFAAKVRVIKPWGFWIGLFVYTGYVGPHVRAKAVEAGFDGCFEKPVKAEQLAEQLKMFGIK